MSISLIDRLKQIPLAFIDTETTGASAAYGDRVIEVGIVRVEDGKVTTEYQQLIDPERWISPAITALTGIDASMTDGQPTFAEQLPVILKIMRGCVIVGHNVNFDLGFLRAEFRLSNRCLEDELGTAHVLDTLRIARRQFGCGGNSLQALSQRLKIKSSDAHRALADAHTTRHLLQRLLKSVGGWDCCLCDAMKHQGGPIKLNPTNARRARQTTRRTRIVRPA